LLEPDLIVKEVELRLNSGFTATETAPVQKSKNIQVLITAGGTSEPIDDIRVITNRSTGKTASVLADHLVESGFEVTFLHSENSLKPKNPPQTVAFTTFNDLQSKLETELKRSSYDWVIHTAAVSDYSVQPTEGKISSDADEITLKLKRNPKLIDQIKKISPKTKLVGFKLTSTTDPKTITEKVGKLFSNAHCDFVVQNDWSDIKNNNRIFNVYSAQSVQPDSIEGLDELSATLFHKILAKETL